MRVLLVEDDAMLGQAVVQALRDADYAVDWVTDGLTASDVLATQEFGFVLLDLGLPGRDGLQVLELLRQRGSQVPTVIVTARDAVQERIAGLDQGADDYLVKPFSVDELMARMRAVTRRRAGQASPVLGNGRISLDPTTRLASVEGREQALSGREFSLLRELLLRPGAILSRAQLEERIYGWNEEVESNVVEYIIHGLRRKLGQDAIRNVRGLGWMVERGDAADGGAR
jgi:two-component system OmpR family response regulator